MKGEIRLNNVIFPIWLLIFWPAAWLIVLPVNFLIDSLVLVLSLAHIKEENKGGLYKKAILKVWIFGFISDIIGVAVMVLAVVPDFFIDSKSSLGLWWNNEFLYHLDYNPFGNILSLIWTIVAVAAAGFFIYQFNRRISFKKLDMEEGHKKKAALYMAVFTAPYVFLFPTSLLFKLFL